MAYRNEIVKPLKTEIFTGVSMGWLRRRDLDTRSADAWEMPDGKLVAIKKGKTPLMNKLEWPPAPFGRESE